MNDDMDIDYILNDKFMHYVNGDIYLSKEQIDILCKYNIDYLEYNDMSRLIFDIEQILNTCSYMDLETVSSELYEFYYYHNVNK